MGGNSTGNCTAALTGFSKSMSVQLWRVNGLLVVNAVLMGVVVGIGAYGQRYRHHPLTRFLFLAATTLFLPIVSSVVSTISNQHVTGFEFYDHQLVTATCSPGYHVIFVLIWTGLVLTIGINTTPIVAADAREGRSITPSIVLLVQVIWASYLAIYSLGTNFGTQSYFDPEELQADIDAIKLLLVFVILFAKSLLKCYAFLKARRSFALQSNPRLVVGYMGQLSDVGQHVEVLDENLPPPLLVMGEETLQVEKQPLGYHLSRMSNQGDNSRIISNHLVTIDKVWQLDDMLITRCKLLRSWTDKMNQCSILMLHKSNTPGALLRRLIPLPEQKKNVKVPREVKAAIINKLRSSEGHLSKGTTSLRQSEHVGDSLLWACRGKGTVDTLLVWHIATSILEVRHPTVGSAHRVVATHLSRYCAYLVAYCPELLPDDDGWSKSLYKAVKKDAEHALAGHATVLTPEDKYQQLVQLLSENSENEVLNNGAKLAKELEDARREEATTWEVLAGFWSEMILYIAPSENLDGHAEAISRGGELITLLWTLLTHVGIVDRPRSDTDVDAAASSAV